MSLLERRISAPERTFQFDADYVVPLPEHWIKPPTISQHPKEIKSRTLERPYYAEILNEYIVWLRQSHRTLPDLPWGEDLLQHYKVLDPVTKDDENTLPTTRFIYEALYSFAAGIATDQIPPREDLKLEKAQKLKDTIIVGTLELMSHIQKLGTGIISFDQDNAVQYMLKPPRKHNNSIGRTLVSTQVDIDISSFGIIFEERLKRLKFDYRSLAVFQGVGPAEGITYDAELALDYNQLVDGERRLCLDIHIPRTIWGDHINGQYLPKRREELIHEYLGENVHHIPLATEIKEKEPFAIDTIKREVMIDLGLSPIIDVSSAFNESRERKSSL